MKPAPFTLHRPETVSEALSLVHASDDAKFVAGGQSLLPMMNFRLARPESLIDVSRLRELDRMFDEGESFLIGALTIHRTLETSASLRADIPLLAEAAAHIGHIAIRNQGTLGGTIAHADAAAELPTALLALNATVFVERHQHGRRELPISEVFDGLYATTLTPDELITWIRVPKPTVGSASGFAEVAPRHGDFAEAGCAVVLRTDRGASGHVVEVRAAFMGVSDRPIELKAVDRILGRLPDEHTLAEAAVAIGTDEALMGLSDHQRHLIAVVFRRACEAAVATKHQEDPHG